MCLCIKARVHGSLVRVEYGEEKETQGNKYPGDSAVWNGQWPQDTRVSTWVSVGRL